MTAIIIALCAVIVAIEVLHWLERRDLYNRIHAKDYREYKQDQPKQPMSKHDAVLRRWRYGKYEDTGGDDA